MAGPDGPDLEGQVQVRKKCLGPGPDWTSDSLTRKEALAAVFILRSYVADINEPFARRLENIIASFGRQTRLDES